MWLQFEIAPQRTILLSSLMFIKTSSNIQPPTLSKQTSTPVLKYSLSLSFTDYFLQSITQSAPNSLTNLHFYYPPAMAQTTHPLALAYCTAICPTPPAAAEITTTYFSLILPIFWSPKYEVSPEMARAKYCQGFLTYFGILVSCLADRTANFCHPPQPITTSPILNLSLLEQMTSPTVKAFITMPGLTGSTQLGWPLIQVLMVASIEMYQFRIMTYPSLTRSVGTGAVCFIWKTSVYLFGQFEVANLVSFICTFSQEFPFILFFVTFNSQC